MSIVGATYAPKTDSGKIFASIYSLAAGLIYVFIMGYFVLSKIIKNYQKLSKTIKMIIKRKWKFLPFQIW